MSSSGYYTVVTDLWHLRLPDPHEYGYETEHDFRQATERLARRWRGRTGERIDERNGFYLLRFHDTPGGVPDEAWVPAYLLLPAPEPDGGDDDVPRDDGDGEIDEAFGFD